MTIAAHTHDAIVDKFEKASQKLFMSVEEAIALAEELGRRLTAASPRPEVELYALPIGAAAE